VIIVYGSRFCRMELHFTKNPEQNKGGTSLKCTPAVPGGGKVTAKVSNSHFYKVFLDNLMFLTYNIIGKCERASGLGM